MIQRDALTLARENHGMLTDNITATQNSKPDFTAGPSAGMTVSCRLVDGVEINATSCSDRFAKPLRGA